MKERLIECLKLFAVMMTIFIALLTATMLLFGGCSRRVVYVPQDRVEIRTDTVVRTAERIRADTVRERVEVYETRRDSVAPILDSTDRVVGWERWHWRETSKLADSERTRLTATIDSLRQEHTDTVLIREPYPVEVVKAAGSRQGWWKTVVTVGLAVLLAYFIVIFIRFIKTRR